MTARTAKARETRERLPRDIEDAISKHRYVCIDAGRGEMAPVDIVNSEIALRLAILNHITKARGR